MSDTDSFIEEVSEEVRRDRLFALMKKYGWIAILLVFLLVGAAALTEYRKSAAQAEAQDFGSKLLSALQSDTPQARVTALDGVTAEGEKTAILSLLIAGEQVKSGAAEQAIDRLEQISQDGNLPLIYRHIAELKLILLQSDELAVEERKSRLQSLAVAGGAFRLLAEEQIALAEIESGDKEGALFRLQGILADGEVTPGLRRRVSQLIVALGGDLEQA